MSDPLLRRQYGGCWLTHGMVRRHRRWLKARGGTIGNREGGYYRRLWWPKRSTRMAGK